MQITYSFLVVLVCCFYLWPQETSNSIAAVSLKLQIYYINYRTKWMAWKMYCQLKKLCKESGFPDPGPFTFVNIWERDVR